MTKEFRKSSLARRGLEMIDRPFDTTELDLETSGGYIVHRDYSAHYFKYGFAGKLCQGKKTLELGCGSKTPLAHTLIFSASYKPPKLYVGIDYGKIKKAPGNKWCTVLENTDATSDQTRTMLQTEFGLFDTIVSLEVIEHMNLESGKQLLKTIHDLLDPEGVAIISTPVYDGQQALNHIHEYEINELQQIIEEAGLIVEKRYGTFMSIKDIKKAFKAKYPDHEEMLLNMLSEVSEFYSNDVVANWFAPHFPDYSRNNVWRLRKA